jgi:hypothetical protein
MSSTEGGAPPARAAITKKRLFIAASALALIGAALALVFTVGKAGGQKGSAQGEATTKLGAGSKPTSDAQLTDVVGFLMPLGPTKTPSVVISAPSSLTKVPGPIPAPSPAAPSARAPKSTGWFRGDVFGDKQSSDARTCSVADVDELTDAVYNRACPMIYLTNGSRYAYALSAELNITRPVTIAGHPMVLPQIDGAAAERCFRVKPGGKLTLQFLRVRQGGGIVRDRYISLPNPKSKVSEILGGAVFIEMGAEGLTAQGVMFLSIANTVNSVITGWQNTLNLVGGRVYGGHVMAMGGNNCEWTSVPHRSGSVPH